MTGLANDLINGIISVANGKLIIALLLTMLCCIVLGMGVLPLPITVSWQQPVLRSWCVWEYLHWQLISLYFTLVLLQISHRR